MLFLLSRTSKSIYIYMLFKFCSRDFPVLHVPEPFFGVPSSTCGFNLCPLGHVKGLDPHRNKCVCGVLRRRRRPFRSFDDQLDCFETLLRLGIISEANAEQGIAVLLDQALGSSLPGFQDKPCLQSAPLLNQKSHQKATCMNSGVSVFPRVAAGLASEYDNKSPLTNRDSRSLRRGALVNKCISRIRY